MTPQEIEALKAERDALLSHVEQLEMCLKDRKALCHQAFDANDALKAERDALAAQNKILLDALKLALPSVETCYKQHMATWETLFLLREAAKATPQQCLRDVRAEAGRKGFIECATRWNFCNAFGEFVSPEEIEAVANEYADTMRQGGAE